MIDPTIWQDEGFGKLSPMARVLFIGLFSNADDDGYLRGSSSILRAMIFPYDDIPLSDVGRVTDEVVKTIKNVHLYCVGDNQYIHLSKWEDYQTQRDDRRQKSKFPMCTKCFSSLKSGKRQTSVGQVTDKGRRKLSKDKLSKDKLSKDKLSKGRNIPSKGVLVKPFFKREDITEAVLVEVANKYSPGDNSYLAFVRSKFEDVCNWEDEKPGRMRKRNWKLTLINWVKRDGLKIQQDYAKNNKRGIDASNL